MTISPELLQAVIARDVRKVRALLAAGHDPNGEIPGAGTPLAQAVRDGETHLAALMVHRGGGDLDRPDFTGMTPAACTTNRFMIGMLRRWADPRTNGDADGRALLNAVKAGDDRLARVLLSAGYDPNREIPGEGTPFSQEMAKGRGYGRLDVDLIVHGLDLRGIDVGGRQAIDACTYDRGRQFMLLLANALDPTPLDPAVVAPGSAPQILEWVNQIATGLWQRMSTSPPQPPGPTAIMGTTATMEIPPRFVRRPPAPASLLERARIGDAKLTPEVAAFYAQTDGADVPPTRTTFFSLERALGLGHQFSVTKRPGDYFQDVGSCLALLPLTDSQDSNPYCLVLGQRLHGAIIRLNHDDVADITHGSLRSFLDALAMGQETGLTHIDDLPDEDLDQALIARFAELDDTPFIAVAGKKDGTGPSVCWKMQIRENKGISWWP